MNKKVSLSLLVTVVILAMTVTFSMTMVTAMHIFDRTVSSVKEKESMYEKLSEIDRYVRDNDYYTMNEDSLYDMLASGYMLGSGDRYARYYTADAYNELLKVQNGTLMGVGVKVVKDASTGYAKVIRVDNGTPAQELGITKGCYITAIDGTETKSVASTEGVQRLLRGENGTTVELSWLSTAAEEHQDKVTRRSYSRSVVEFALLSDKCGYIRIWDFTDKTASDLDFAISQLKSGGAKSIIFDLRDNASTDLTAAMDAIDLVCPAGDIATAMYKNGDTQLLGYSEADTQLDLPFVCLVNNATANAAELFAAAGRQLAGAKLVGVTTAGKGMMQSAPKMLSDGSAVVVTVGSLLTSDGTSFESTGLTVDVERALNADEMAAYYDYTPDNDPQIQKALKVAVDMAGGSTVGQESGNTTQEGAEAAGEPDAETTDGEAESTEADQAVSDKAETDKKADEKADKKDSDKKADKPAA